jgi:hypothetical protein
MDQTVVVWTSMAIGKATWSTLARWKGDTMSSAQLWWKGTTIERSTKSKKNCTEKYMQIRQNWRTQIKSWRDKVHLLFLSPHTVTAGPDSMSQRNLARPLDPFPSPRLLAAPQAPFGLPLPTNLLPALPILQLDLWPKLVKLADFSGPPPSPGRL